jgi:hypothetical protein
MFTRVSSVATVITVHVTLFHPFHTRAILGYVAVPSMPQMDNVGEMGEMRNYSITEHRNRLQTRGYFGGVISGRHTMALVSRVNVAECGGKRSGWGLVNNNKIPIPTNHSPCL